MTIKDRSRHPPDANPAFGLSNTGPGRVIVAAVVTVAVIVTLLAFADLEDLAAAIGAVGPFDIIALLALGAFLNLASALRLVVARKHGRSCGVARAMGLTLEYGLWVAVLPLRLAEQVFAWRLARALKARLSEAVSIVLMLRLCDVIVVGSGLLAGSLLIWPLSWGGRVLLPVLGVALAGFAVWRLPSVVKTMTGIAVRLVGRQATGFRRRLVWGMFCAGRSFEYMSSARRQGPLLALTILEWLAVAYVTWFVLSLGGMTLTAVEVLVAMTGAQLLSLVPLQSFGGVGTYDVGMSGILILLGLEPERSATLVILLRIVWVTLPVALWLIWLPVARRAYGSETENMHVVG